jgi:malonyl CoA-acyl carrier protein transacylase
MNDTSNQAIAIVGLGAILPDAPDVGTFWQNLLNKRYSIGDVPDGRWSVADYYDPDPAAPDKTYSKIGGWVQGFEFDWKRFRMPPKVAAAMDEGQQWAVTIAADALADYGYPERPLDTERTAVVLGTAMGGERHYLTNLRINFPEFANALKNVSEFNQLPAEVREAILARWQETFTETIPPITEDTMPGELPNIVSGRVANILNLRGPNFITDAACASSFAAVEAAMELLNEHKVDAVLTGGVDRNMGIGSFVKFCKIGALSATGTRPFGDGADGFVMGEGAATFLLKRLEDAEQAGDKIYAVIRGVGGSSDGKGKGITAPNPIGQQLAIQRAWQQAGLDPASATLVEAHGTSTKVGDVVEVESLSSIFCGAPARSIALGSVKSNIGHLKAGAGAAGLLKTVLALHHQILPPTLNAERPNPNINFADTPFALNHTAREWQKSNGSPRRAGVSAYGFGGTNFHVVLEEYVPGMLRGESKQYSVNSEQLTVNSQQLTVNSERSTTPHPLTPSPLRGILALGAQSIAELHDRLEKMVLRLETGWTPPVTLPDTADIAARERLVIDFANHDELLDKTRKAQKAMSFDNPQAWKALQAQGIFRGSGPKPGKVAFLFPGQGSQYVNMGRELAKVAPEVTAVFAEADRVMTPILNRPLTDYIFAEPEQVMAAEMALMQTAVTQPAMLTLDEALHCLLASYGFQPDMVMGHSLGEYAALVAAGIMPFADALEAAAARGSEMSKVSVDDNGKMAAVLAPFETVEQILQEVGGYVVPANINSYGQSVIGGASQDVERAVEAFTEKGYRAIPLPVSHAFHTRIVAPASAPLRQMLDRLHLEPPKLPLVANLSGDFYPQTVEEIKDVLQAQIASPVQWVKGLETLYTAGVRIFVEVGPKKALKGFVDDVLGDKPDVISLFTNHPKTGELASFNQALCGLYAAGCGEEMRGSGDKVMRGVPAVAVTPEIEVSEMPEMKTDNGTTHDSLEALSQLLQTLGSNRPSAQFRVYDRNEPPTGSVVVTGTGLGLPGAEKAVMDPENAMRILRGEQFVDLIPERFRKRMLAKRVTRLVKTADGNGRFETITNPDEVIKLAGRPGKFDLTAEYGVPEKLVEALDITTQLAMAAGFDALREAGIPLVQSFRKTTTGRHLPDRWQLPEALRDETAVIFASAFPGGDKFADEFSRYYSYQNRLEQQQMLQDLRRYATDTAVMQEIDHRLADLRDALAREPYEFDRRFLFRILSMGHSQFAEYIGARGPNTQVNAACASTTQAIALAEDWIRSGRCRRVIVIGADDVTSDNMMEWVGAGFLATGAAATDDRVEEAAIPFDRRRHGTIIGMGACALVLESEDAVQERGMRGLVELLSSESNNSAFHGTRLDVNHIAQVMDNLVTAAERRFGLHRQMMAPQLVFMSHETFTPARGGSASAEVVALRHTFGEGTNEIIMANTKGFTGHPMGVGVEDVIAVKILEHGIVPPVPNFKEVDPDLGPLNLSRGGRYPVQYALHLAAGFGSQIAMTLTRRIPGGLDRVDNKPRYQCWLEDMSGYDRAELEVEKRILRVKAMAAPGRSPVASNWQPGTGPVVRTVVSNQYSVFSKQLTVNSEQLAVNGERLPVSEGQYGREQVASEESPNLPVSQSPNLAVSSPPISQSPISDLITPKVLKIVATQTGYPPEMLDLDLDLEADLGIDTVKQAETFAAIRKAFDIPRRDDLKLRDYPTLARVVEFVKEMKRELAVNSEQSTVNSQQSTVNSEQLAVSSGQVASGKGQVAGEESSNLPVSPPTISQSPTSDNITSKVLEIVAQQTGYPPEMLELDLDMEADLGIDTVKQAETFAAIRKAFDIPRRDDLRLRDYPTLGAVIGFVKESLPVNSQQLAVNSELAASEKSPNLPITQLPITNYQLEDSNQLPRRVPMPALRPSLHLCKATSVTLDAQSRVIIMPDKGGVGQALSSQLQAKGVQTLMLDAPFSSAAVQQWLAEGPIHGVYWLAALDEEPGLEEMELGTWQALNQERVKNLYAVMRVLDGVISQPEHFLVTAVHLGGLHGYGAEGATAPLGGAVTGFSKAFKRERPSTLVKTVDFGTETAESIASHLIAETLYDPGVVEVGYWRDGRYTITLSEQPIIPEEFAPPGADGAPGGAPLLKLGKESVFVITGAAGGITSAIVEDLAAVSGGTFYLLDLVAPPDPKDAHIALFRESQEALKQRLIEEAKTAGEKATPAAIDKKIMATERAEAALRAIEVVQQAGGIAYYHSADLRDGTAVTTIINDIRQRHGRIDVLLHAAGLEISRTLADKDPDQFNLVFDVKADGFFNLLHAAKEMPIAAVVAFSSVAGRFGNNGQTDYSAANDLLCKISSSLRRWRPETRGIVIDWTAWGNIGMATRGSIPKMMEMAGIDMLAPEVGVPTVRRELLYSPGQEIVVAGQLGMMVQEFDETGGLDRAKTAEWLAAQTNPFLMVGDVKAAKLYGGIEVETTFDPHNQPFLADHELEGVPLLPGVMGTEAFAELAAVLAPAYSVAAVENVQFQRPFKFYHRQPQTLYLSMSVEPLANGDLLAHGTLCSKTRPSKPELPVQEKVHFTADIRLTRTELGKPAIAFKAPSANKLDIGQEAIYKIYFHGPAYKVLEKARVEAETATGAVASAVGLLTANLPPNTNPANAVSLMAPRLIELCFQTAGVWEIKTKGVMALPMGIGRVTTYRQPEEANGHKLYALVQAIHNGETFNAQVVDEAGNVYVELVDYRTVQLPGKVQL